MTFFFLVHKFCISLYVTDFPDIDVDSLGNNVNNLGLIGQPFYNSKTHISATFQVICHFVFLTQFHATFFLRFNSRVFECFNFLRNNNRPLELSFNRK